MKRLFYIVSFLLPMLMASAVLMASDAYQIHGSHYVVPAPVGVDEVVVFSNLDDMDAYIECNVAADWYDFSGSRIAQNTTSHYPQEGGVEIRVAGQKVVSIAVVDLASHAMQSPALSCLQDCDRAVLKLEGMFPSLAYKDTLNAPHTISRQLTLSYTQLGWNGTQWADSAVNDTLSPKYDVAQQSFVLPALLRDSTVYTLSWDANFYGAWGGEVPQLTDTALGIAVAAHPGYVVTARGDRMENEPKRPIGVPELSSTIPLSAPVEVNFLANANKPVAQFYRWRITKGSDLIAERFDEEQRYTFRENGLYTITLWVYNDTCQTDSMSFNVSVSESDLRIPNVFTPNGDGMNDEFRVAYTSLSEFHCWVYNRWGKLVYQWDDPAKGWDGTINGHPAAEGAYYYIIRARGTDANPNDKYHKVTKRRTADVGVYQRSGHINLIRGKQ